VQRVLTELACVASAAVRVEAGRPVAYVVPTDPALPVTDLHDQFCAAIGDRTDLLAPAHYTLCASAPDPTGDWATAPVLRDGTGREG
jgi:hypothetical protein